MHRLKTKIPSFRDRAKETNDDGVLENRVGLALQNMLDAFIKTRRCYDLYDMEPEDEQRFAIDLQQLVQGAMGYDVCRHVDQTQLIVVTNLTNTRDKSRKMKWRTQYLVACELSRIHAELYDNKITKEEAEALYSDQDALGLSPLLN